MFVLLDQAAESFAQCCHAACTAREHCLLVDDGELAYLALVDELCLEVLAYQKLDCIPCLGDRVDAIRVKAEASKPWIEFR